MFEALIKAGEAIEKIKGKTSEAKELDNMLTRTEESAPSKGSSAADTRRQ
jgi:hypothetical protein